MRLKYKCRFICCTLINVCIVFADSASWAYFVLSFSSSFHIDNSGRDVRHVFGSELSTIIITVFHCLPKSDLFDEVTLVMFNMHPFTPVFLNLWCPYEVVYFVSDFRCNCFA